MAELYENNLIEKSKALVWAEFNDYTVGELRLLEVYLSRINPRDEKSSEVKFTLSEYCDLLGLRVNSRNIEKQIEHFLGNVVTLPLNDDGSEYNMYTLFTKASVTIDKNLGMYVVTLCCNPELRSVFFDIAKSGYIKYRLRYTVKMKSQYSILLYSMLRDMMNRGGDHFDISINRLRSYLGANAGCYESFKNFRRRVLNAAVEEINDVSDIYVNYEKISFGNKAVAISFVAKKKDEKPVAELKAKEYKEELPFDDDIPVIKPNKNAYSDVDWENIAPDLEKSECIGIARMVGKKMTESFPTIKAHKKKAAVINIVSNAYNKILKDKKEWPDNPAGYLYRVIENSDLDEFATFDDSFLK